MTKDEKREKNRLKNIEWRKKNPENYLRSAAKYRNNNRTKIRKYKLGVKYGVTLEEYDVMFQKQNGKCSICGKEETTINFGTKQVQALAVDHCHKTGKIRELLCQDCNQGLGLFNDDPDRIQKAADYIDKHKNKEVI
jgi:hypothetical protein